jgi:hypothetical protein
LKSVIPNGDNIMASNLNNMGLLIYFLICEK